MTMFAVEQGRWTVPQVEGGWVAVMSPDPTADVIVRRSPATAVPADYFPETWQLTRAEWETLHEVNYGLALDGTPIAAHNELKAAWRKIRRMKNGADPYDEEHVRAAFGAVQRILKVLIKEIQED